MCGFIGYFSKNSKSDKEWLIASSKLIVHRGPDDNGEWFSEDQKIGFAHRRLAILDLSNLGHQPMHLNKLDLTIVFNGEIYNHVDLRNELKQLGYKFLSNSDTEVLLLAYSQWGENCLSKLNGMFAFAIYDNKRKKIFLARDRAGEKPLFYYFKNNSLYFGSELKTLLSNPNLPRYLDEVSFDSYLSVGYVPGNRCILKDYNKLPPAHALTYEINTNKFNLWKYWKIPELLNRDEEKNEDHLLEELELLLNQSISRQLVADVPVGVLLSGGVDSSLITAIAAKSSSKISTFNVSFPGHEKHNESEHAKRIANYFNTNHTELVVEENSADLMPILSKQFDEPMADSSMFPTFLLSKIVRQHCKVAVGGDGGDEIFGGYNHYSRLLWIKKNLSSLPNWLKKSIGFCGSIMPEGFKGKNYLEALSVNFEKDIPLVQNFFNSSTRNKLINKQQKYFCSNKTNQTFLGDKENDFLQKLTRRDFENYLADDILVKVDRASMLNSLEIRSPFLDKNIIEFAFAKIPSYLKSTSNNKKILLKKLARRLLPSDFDTNRKQGFSIPLAKWLKAGPFRELFWDTLNSNDCVFEKKIVKKLLSNQDRGFNNAERLFALVQFELWRKNYSIEF